MDTIISNSPVETLALGERWGREMGPASLIGLSGDLGAGKTQLVQGLAKGLDIAERISSPSFALVNESEGGRLPFWHIDLYRLMGWEEIVGAGIEEYLFDTTGVVVVEWIDRWLTGTQKSAYRHRSEGLFRWVKIEIVSETERQIEYEDFGN